MNFVQSEEAGAYPSLSHFPLVPGAAVVVGPDGAGDEELWVNDEDGADVDVLWVVVVVGADVVEEL